MNQTPFMLMMYLPFLLSAKLASKASPLLSEGPSFSQTTLYHEFLEGTDGMVPCLATGKLAVDVVWLRDKQTFSSDGRVPVFDLQI